MSCSSPSEKAKTKENTAPKEIPYQVYTVEIKDMKFVPDSITVKKGDEVVFVNRDIVTHCVTEETSKAWTSSALASGESYLLVAKESSNYYCAIHRVMRGKIIVK
jgi:plastocyanin